MTMRGCNSRPWRAIARTTACTSSICSAAITASCISLAPNWASRSPALPSFAATATLPRTERLARWREFHFLVDQWMSLASDFGAKFDKTVELDATQIAPQVTWGTNPGMVTSVTDRVPDPNSFRDPDEQKAAVRALEYMDLRPGTPIVDILVDRVFIGSCTNSRLEDLRAVARVVRGKHVARTLKAALVVPGSRVVKAKAEAEGLDRILREAGFEWRDAGCSMCIGMNEDVLPPGERSASTSNRNFEGRQGKGSRTHLVSPIMAAAAAIAGHFVDVRELGVDVTE